MIDKITLSNFLIQANKFTYAADGEKTSSTRLGSSDFEYSDGDLQYHDTYFGGRSFIGEEVVYQNELPVWGMNYYGKIIDQNFSEKVVYDFLKLSLMQNNTEIIPVRGPKLFESNEYKYVNKLSGDLDSFEGQESIFYQDREIYNCLYHGGLIE